MSDRRRRPSGDPDIAPERGGRPRRVPDAVDPTADGPVPDPDTSGTAATGTSAGAAASESGAGDGDTHDTADDADDAASPERAGRRNGRRGRRARGAARKKAPWWELPVLVVVAIAVAIVVKTFLIQPFYIPSASMETTLHGCPGCSGDRVVVNKPIYTVIRDPHPGDIVVFKAPPGWDDETTSVPSSSNPLAKGVRWFGQLVGVVPPDEEDLIKRVIAVGGQTVKCCDAAGNVQVSDNGPNGTFHSIDDSSFVYEEDGQAAFGQLAFGPVTVPAGRLWVMGDHRNDSKDSRYHCGGTPTTNGTVCSDGSAATAQASTVPVDLVIGKAFVIAWPPSRWTTLGTPPTFDTVPLPGAAAASPALSGLAGIGPLGFGLVAAGTVGGWRRRRRGRRRGRGRERGPRSASSPWPAPPD